MTSRRRRFGPQPIGSFWESVSPKLQRVVRLESSLEYYHWILLEADFEIEWFHEHPGWIQFGPGWSVPDMWVRYRSGHQEIREIKTSQCLEFDSDGLITNRQIVIQRQWCQANGIAYQIVTEIELLANQTKLENWRRILRHLCAGEANKELEVAIVESLSYQVTVSLIEIRKWFSGFDEGIVDRCVFRLLHEGVLTGDVDSRPLTKGSQFWKRSE